MRVLTLPEETITIRLRGWASRRAKRLMDIIVSALALFFLAPVFALIARAIKRDSPGPVFYGGLRVGKGARVFKIWKFRTMYEEDRSYQGARVTAHDDERITPLGHWLRNTKLNEMPQFWNVLIGEMSLVGPRPEDPALAAAWPKEVRDEILSVRPGITSPASVQYRNEEKLLSQGNATQKYIQDLSPDKIRLDQIYVRHHGFWMDLDTLFWTFLLLLPKISAYNPPESLLFVGPATRLVRRYLNWFTIDALTTLAALALSGVRWRFSGPLNLGWPRSIAFGVAFSLLYSLMGAAMGVNRISWSKANFSDALDLVPSWFLATIAIYIYNATVHLLPAGLVLLASLLSLCGFIFTRYRSRLLSVIFSWISQVVPGVKMAGERVLIVGSDAAAQHAAWLLTHPNNVNKFWVVGFVDNDIFRLGMRIYGSSILGTREDIPNLIVKHDIGLVLITDLQQIKQDYRLILRACRDTSVRLVILPNLFQILNNLEEISPSIPVTSQGRNIENCDNPEIRFEERGSETSFEEEENPCLHCLASYEKFAANAYGAVYKSMDDCPDGEELPFEYEKQRAESDVGWSLQGMRQKILNKEDE